MRKICFHIAKGGVGKSSLAGNCAHLAARSVKTVLVDADPQGNTSSWFIKQDYRYELADYLMSAGDMELSDVLLQVDDNFYILPTSGLTGGLKDYAEVRLFRQPLIFDSLNADLEDAGFQVVVYDLSPGLSQLERSVILSCDECVLPVLGEYFSIDGIETACIGIREINRDFKRDVQYRRLVVNGLNRSFRRHREAYEEFQKLDFEIFTVAQDSKIPEAQYQHKPLAVYYPHSKAIPELERLTAAITGGSENG